MFFAGILFIAFMGAILARLIIGTYKFLRPLFSGWLTIPKKYRQKATATGTALGVHTVELGFGDTPSMKFDGCVAVYLSRTHLYLDYIGMVNWLYPLLKLPLDEMEIYSIRSMWPDDIIVRLSEPNCPNFFFKNPISEELSKAKLDHLPEFG